MEKVRKLGPYFHKAQGYNYYIYIYPDGKRKTVYQHREIAEKESGRTLKKSEHVHHDNENKTDNRKENLKILSAGEHTRLHHRPAKIVNLLCAFCGKLFKRPARKVIKGRPVYCSYHCAGKAHGFSYGFKGTPIRHGLVSSYSYRKCRCVLCTAAHAEKQRRYMERKRGVTLAD